MPDEPLAIATLLSELGFDAPESQARARALLIENRLTTPAKQGISVAKRPRVEELLRAQFIVTCATPACKAASHDGRTHVLTHDRRHCWICGGSDNRRAVEAAAEAFAAAGVKRIVIVGGSPAVHDELRQLQPPGWELRLVDGTERRTGDAARSDLRWADLVIVWGSTELDHKVSGHYTREGLDKVVHVTRRGIAAILDEAVKHLRGRRGR